tara:strand:+ start:3231 stop:4127 length:897 start_codon:yes stop_codon:yes gene_type:complete
MKAIVTGSSGFIGSRLCHFLDEKDYSVIKIARTEKEDHQVDLICDFETDKLKDGAMVGVDTVFHLAGHAHDVSDPKRSIERYVKLNIDATKDLAIQASEEGVNTFIFVSSVKAGFSSSKDEKLKEPLSIYGKTKRKAELELIEFSKHTDMKLLIIRPSLVYGPNLKGNLFSMKKAINQGWFPPLPVIKNKRSMVHVDDLVRAILLVHEKGVESEIYNITDGFNYSTTEIYETLCKILEKNPPKWRLPLFIFNMLSFIPGRINQTISKLLEDESYSSSKIESLGFTAKLRFGDMNETLF